MKNTMKKALKRKPFMGFLRIGRSAKQARAVCVRLLRIFRISLGAGKWRIASFAVPLRSKIYLEKQWRICYNLRENTGVVGLLLPT